MTKNLWETESDIFTDYEGTITDATFQFNEYGGQMSFTVDEIDGREQPTFERFNLPPGWESNDGGETVERVDGQDKGFKKSSQWGKFIMAAGECNGAREELGDDAPRTAASWIGTRWHWEVTEAGKGKPYNFTNDAGEKVQGTSKDKNYPTEFLGKDKVEIPASNGKVDDLSVLTDLHNPMVESKIAELAKSLDHGTWFKEGYKVITEAGVSPSDVPDLITAMGGRGLYESLGGKG